MFNFYQIRVNRQFKKMMKYMKYILNDHFVLVCLFLFGAFGYYYSELLKTLPEDYLYGRPIVGIIWFMSLFIGRLATLMEEADKVFILPKERQMNGYLTKAFRHSMWLPLVVLLLISGISMPLLVVSTNHQFSSFFSYLLMLFFLKISHMLVQKHKMYQISIKKAGQSMLLWSVTSLVIIFLSLYLMPLLGVVLSVFQMIIFYTLLSKKEEKLSLDWEKMIQVEQARVYRIYQFIHLFTDVPEIASNVKRRKYLDPLMSWVKKNHANTFMYLYVHSFLRDSEYSGLLVRLVVLGGIILFFLADFWLSLGVALVFVYLIGFQLIPLYARFDYMVMTNLYPVPDKQKKQAINQLITILLGISAFIFVLFSGIGLASIQQACLILLALLVEIGLFANYYVPKRLKKMQVM